MKNCRFNFFLENLDIFLILSESRSFYSISSISYISIAIFDEKTIEHVPNYMHELPGWP